MATSSPLLNLLTERERHHLTIDGVRYEFRNGDDLSLADNQRLITLGARMEALEALTEPTDAQAQEYAELVLRLCHVALIEIPDDVLQRLKQAQRAAVLSTFIELSASSLLRLRARQGATSVSPAAGTNSSRASSASTAAPPPRGAKKPRSAASARA